MSEIVDKSETPRIGSDLQLPPPSRRWYRRSWLVWVVLLVVLGLLAFAVISIRNQNQREAAVQQHGHGRTGGTVPVTVSSAQRGNIGVYLAAIDTVTSV